MTAQYSTRPSEDPMHRRNTHGVEGNLTCAGVAALGEPALLAEDVRAFFRLVKVTAARGQGLGDTSPDGWRNAVAPAENLAAAHAVGRYERECPRSGCLPDRPRMFRSPTTRSTHRTRELLP